MNRKYSVILLLNLSITSGFLTENIAFSSDYSCKCLPGDFPGLDKDESRYVHKKQCEYSMLYKSLFDVTKITLDFLRHPFESKKINEERLLIVKKTFTAHDCAKSLFSQEEKHTYHLAIATNLEKLYKSLDPEIIFSSTKEASTTTLHAEKTILSKAFLNLKLYTDLLCDFFSNLTLSFKNNNEQKPALFNYECGLVSVINALYSFIASHLCSEDKEVFAMRFFKFFDSLDKYNNSIHNDSRR